MGLSMIATAIGLLLLSLQCLAASNCSITSFDCPTPDGDYCLAGSLEGNAIYRCADGCPSLGNCNLNLVGAPPIGTKTSARCWEDSPDAGNAQCTIDCVAVDALNGSSIYPVGCSFSVPSDSANSTSAPSSVSLTIFATSTDPAESASTATSTLSTTSSDGGAVPTLVGGMGSGVAVVAGLLPLLF